MKMNVLLIVSMEAGVIGRCGAPLVVLANGESTNTSQPLVNMAGYLVVIINGRTRLEMNHSALRIALLMTGQVMVSAVPRQGLASEQG